MTMPSAKHVATARFHRNHKLVAEIFNEQAVPDIKTIVTRPRLENLKKQVQSLMQHQRKLEQEIEEAEQRHETRKRKILESSAKFQEAIKKIKEKPLSSECLSDDLFSQDSYDSSTSLEKEGEDPRDENEDKASGKL